MKNMRAFRSAVAGVLCFLMYTHVTPAQQAPAEDPQFKVTVREVIAPVTVVDRDGNLVNGLQPHQFHLSDNGKEQDIRVDVTYQPISLVVAIQASAQVESILPQVKRLGALLRPLVIGDQGEAAVLAFDSRLRVLQPFTNDSDKVEQAIKKINAGSYTSRMVDAVMDATRMLGSRPKDRRRIILLITETRDMGSEGRKRETIIALQMANVELYSVDISRLIATLTTKPQPPRPDPMPPTQRQGTLPPNVPATPTSVQQTFGLNGSRVEFLPLLKEILKDTKDIFVDNPVEVFTKGTGGQEFSFVRQRGLEDAVTKIGEILHSQYIITYSPNNQEEPGFHEIAVAVTGLSGVKVRTRPGYWVAAKYR
jgi:VWFA-related protein